MAIFSTFFSRHYSLGKCLLWYSRTKKRLSWLSKQEVQKVKILTFFHGVNPWFWSKNGHFSDFFFLGTIGQESVFFDILERKNAFLGCKNKKFKKSKNWDFCKGVNPWFWSKNGNFSNFFFFRNIGQKNVFYDILKRKNAFLGYKNKKFKKSKNRHFSHGFGPKNGCFSNFFFTQYRLGKYFLWYSRSKNAFLGY